jgi:hypothetical protein
MGWVGTRNVTQAPVFLSRSSQPRRPVLFCWIQCKSTRPTALSLVHIARAPIGAAILTRADAFACSVGRAEKYVDVSASTSLLTREMRREELSCES